MARSTAAARAAFDTGPQGYVREQVDAYMAGLSDPNQAPAAAAGLLERAQRAAVETMAAADEAAQLARDRAAQEAQRIVAEATQRAAGIVAEAQADADRIQEQVGRLRQERDAVVEQVHSLSGRLHEVATSTSRD